MKVDVYKNLHKDIWSVRNRSTGKVVAHKKIVYVSNASFVVQPAGRKRVLDEKRKNVHAFVRGMLFIDYPPERSALPLYWRLVTYNPYKADYFYYEDTGEKVTQASTALLNEDGAWVPTSHTKYWEGGTIRASLIV